MPCPTCSHTMHNLGLTEVRVFWCPRCGTIKTNANSPADTGIPKLVSLVRDAEALAILTSVDHKTLQYAAHSHFWIPICECTGIKPHSLSSLPI